MGLTEFKRCWQDCVFFLEALREDLFPCSFQLLEFNTFLDSWPHSLFKASNADPNPSHIATSLVLVCFPLSLLRTPCNHIVPIQIMWYSPYFKVGWLAISVPLCHVIKYIQKSQGLWCSHLWGTVLLSILSHKWISCQILQVLSSLILSHLSWVLRFHFFCSI